MALNIPTLQYMWQLLMEQLQGIPSGGGNSFPEYIYIASYFEAPAKAIAAIVFVLQKLAVPGSHICTYFEEVKAWKKFLPSRPIGSPSASHGIYILFIVFYYCNGLQN